MSLPDIKSMTIEELAELMSSFGEKPFRAKQLFSWMHEKSVASIEDMTNLSKTLRQRLETGDGICFFEESNDAGVRFGRNQKISV